MHFDVVLLSPSPNTHRQFLPHLGTTLAFFPLFPYSLPSLPRDFALSFHLPEMTFPLMLHWLFTSLTSSGHTHLLSSFLFVVPTRDTAMVMAEFQNQCSHVHPKSYIVFLCWRCQCSWMKVGFRMWWKLSWSIYMQNTPFLIEIIKVKIPWFLVRSVSSFKCILPLQPSLISVWGKVRFIHPQTQGRPKR